MKKHIIKAKAIPFILTASILTTNLPTYSNVSAVIPESDEISLPTKEELVAKNKENIKQAIDNDDVSALQYELYQNNYIGDPNGLRFNHTFNFLNGQDTELPLLHYAIANKRLNCFKFLLVNGFGNPKETVTIPGLDVPFDAITISALVSKPGGDLEFLLILNEYESSPYQENSSVWFAAGLAHKHSLIESLISHFSWDNSEIPLDCLHAGLVGAVLGNDLATVKKLIQNGANINSADSKGRTLLHLTAQSNSPDVADFLIENCTNPLAEDLWGNTPLHIAAKYNSLDVTRLLIARSASVDLELRRGFRPLHIAAAHDSFDVAQLLIEKGADINATTPWGYAPLHYACSGIKVAKLLIEKGANVNAVSQHTEAYYRRTGKTASAETPLHIACQNGNLDVAKLLIANGADVNVKDSNGQTPLDLATDLEIISLLQGSNISN